MCYFYTLYLLFLIDVFRFQNIILHTKYYLKSFLKLRGFPADIQMLAFIFIINNLDGKYSEHS